MRKSLAEIKKKNKEIKELKKQKTNYVIKQINCW